MMALPLLRVCGRRTDAELAPASWGKTSEAVLPEAIAKKSACEYLTRSPQHRGVQPPLNARDNVQTVRLRA